jgi:phosphoenolpyruvate synthase/pyruvate phosphate dikinase
MRYKVVVDQILQTLRNSKMILGAINIDEDIHFSSFYLRASSHIGSVESAFKYNFIVEINQDFREFYFIPEEECLRVANNILNRIKSDNKWIECILTEIDNRSNRLSQIFNDWDLDNLHSLSVGELLQLYYTHNDVQRSLYDVARIPEALDRGISFFTNTLREQLATYLGPYYSTTTLNAEFLRLTTPNHPSIVQEASLAWQDLVHRARSYISSSDMSSSPGRLLMNLPTNLHKEVLAFQKQWQYLDYHGYGSRETTSKIEYLQRLIQDLRSNVAPHLPVNPYSDSPSPILISGEIIDSELFYLFRLYGRIGLSKIRRRVAQLKAFYYLDQLLNEFATRLQVPEAILRCMLPEEIEVALTAGEIDVNRIEGRRTLLAYIIDGDQEYLFSDIQAQQIYEIVMRPTKNPQQEQYRLPGVPTSLGMYQGIARIVYRSSRTLLKSFQEGEILISEAIDPDLLPLISQAGAVVTQQGGVTAHGSILCRELEKPALAGVANLLDSVQDGDEIIVNANEGFVEIVKPRQLENPAHHFQHIIWPQQISTEHGNKARCLKILFEEKYRVPHFFVIPWEQLNLMMSINFSSATIFRQDIENAVSRLGSLSLAVRSSSLIEDNSNLSNAGWFPTLLNIPSTQIWNGLQSFVEQIRTKNLDTPYQGSIIIQQMIQGEVGGVCFTADPVTSDRSVILIELTKGDNQSITSGHEVDMRIIFSKNDLNIIGLQGTAPTISENKLNQICKIAIEIEKLMKFPQDIEWIINDNEIYILQTRPITTLI